MGRRAAATSTGPSLRLLGGRPPLRGGRVLAGPRLRGVWPARGALGNVSARRLVGRVHALARAVLHAAHAWKGHAGLHLAGARLPEVRGGRLRGMGRLRLRRVAPVVVAGRLGVLRPHGLVGLVVVARICLANVARGA